MSYILVFMYRYGATVWSGKSVNVVKHVWGERGAQVSGLVAEIARDVG